MSIGEQDPERRYYRTPQEIERENLVNKSLDATKNQWIENERNCFQDIVCDGSGNDELVPNNDAVNHPSHYTDRKMEAIEIIELIIETEKNPKVSYNMSNVLKYLLRFRSKGKAIEDLRKAQWYLNRMIKHVEEE